MNTTSRRPLWINAAHADCEPFLLSLINDTFQYAYQGDHSRSVVSHLEAVARIAMGLAPWIQSQDPKSERLKALIDPALNKVLNKEGLLEHKQSLLEFGHLACAFLRSRVLFDSLSYETRQDFTRLSGEVLAKHRPLNNNWKAIVSCLLVWRGDNPSAYFHDIEEWYKGDGHYGDGAFYRNDYYNSFAIHPLLYDALAHYPSQGFDRLFDTHVKRFTRLCHQLERLVMPDGRYPIFGRSAAYGIGNFHALAYGVSIGIFHKANTSVTLASLGSMMTEMLKLNNPIQEHKTNSILIEDYITTGSWLGKAFFYAPLALPEDCPFWTDYEPWTQSRIWLGHAVPTEDQYLEPIPKLFEG